MTTQFTVAHPGMLSPGAYTIGGFGSKSNPIVGCMKVAICLPEGTCKEAHSFAVVESQMMPFCIIFGADYLIENGVTLDFVRGVQPEWECSFSVF